MTTIENLYYGNIALQKKHVDPESRLDYRYLSNHIQM